MSQADDNSSFEAPAPADLDQLLPAYEFQALIAKGINEFTGLRITQQF